MKKNVLFFSIISSIMCTTNLHAWWWSKSQPPTIQTVIQELQQKQADSPNDPYVNYNLGVALYKAGKFSQAQTNFERAVVSATQPDLKKRCYFNMGNSLYKDARTSLPDNWEQQDVPAETLDAAIGKTSFALQKYESVLLLDKNHEPAQTNQKAAKEFLEKLTRKKQQQEKKDQNKKDQKQDKNKDKDDKNKDKQQQQGNNEQQGQDKSNQQDHSQKQEQQKQPQPKDQGDKEKQQENNQQQKEEQGKGEQKKNPHDKQQQQKQQGQAPNQTPQPDQQQNAQGANAAENKPENMEQRGMRALLDNLQQDEARLQKALVVKQLKENEKPRESSQRPW